jgi:hypothetical protein
MYREIAQQTIDNNYKFRKDPAFAAFADGHFPGESILVTRMVYEIIKRLKLADVVPAERLAFFREERANGMGVEFIEQTFANIIGNSDSNQFFAEDQQKALTITFEEGIAVPHVQAVRCENENEWRNLLLTLNQDAPSGAKRRAIVIHSAKDLVRLRRAVALKDVVKLNNGSETLTLDQFQVGQYVLIPDTDVNQVHIIDAEVAKYFYHTEHYYAATLQEIRRAIDTLEAALSEKAIQN